ncbi:MAG: adenosine-specific kinase [Candidatus Micrarchaeota archaeon]|nr:adenosine-specific kinase [Candidatus Micrarchaeota archaeon]MDE1834855.1 adenosine-specific kinase [Candidatus Micrarchaeota archaeon]
MADIQTVNIDKDPETQIIIGHAGFIKTVEDLYEAMMESSPGVKFGLAFVEASGACLIRSEGNDPKLKELAQSNAIRVGAGHTFVVLFKNAYPINVNNAIKDVSEVVRIYCSTANPVQVLVTETDQGRAILGIVDGYKPRGIEQEGDKEKRKKLLRDLGYKVQ